MKLLKCKLCLGEVDLINPHDRSIHKKIKCRSCEFTNSEPKSPEVVVIRRRPINPSEG